MLYIYIYIRNYSVICNFILLYEKSQKHTLHCERSLKHDQYSTAYCLQVSRVSNIPTNIDQVMRNLSMVT